MQHLVFLLLLCLPLRLVSNQLATAQAPQEVPEPQEEADMFEGADEIAIYTADSLYAAVHTMQQVFRQAGYDLDTTITNIDRTRFLVSTKSSRIPAVFQGKRRGWAYAKAYVTVQNGYARLLLTGYCVVPPRQQHYKVPMDKTCFQGPPQGHRWAAFRHLEMVARAYPHGRVTYRAGWPSEYH